MVPFSGLGLNRSHRFCHAAMNKRVGTFDAPRQSGVRTIDGTPSAHYPSALRSPLPRRAQGQVVFPPRSVPVGVSLGAVPYHQGGDQVAHAARSARQYPDLIHINDGKLHEVNILDQLLPDSGAFYRMDRGFLDFARLRRFWQVALFFTWIKQLLRIKAFFGTSENVVKTQIWITIAVYVLVAVVKKRLNLTASLYEMLQMLSLTRFEKIPLDQLLAQSEKDQIRLNSGNQLFLFE